MTSSTSDDSKGLNDSNVVPLNHLYYVNEYYKKFRISPMSISAPKTPYIKASSNPRKRKRKKLHDLFELPDANLLNALELARTTCLPSILDLLPEYVRNVEVVSERNPSNLVFELIDGIVMNDTDEEEIFVHLQHQYILPKHSSFILGNVLRLPSMPEKYNFIVMDPPWENRTVKRGHRYGTLPHTDIAKIDIPSLMHPNGCTLAIWVTNKPLYTSYIMDVLLPQWGFHNPVTWYWLKLSSNGEFVTPIDSTHKLPFERVIVATTNKISTPIPSKTFVSVPLRHSWKPPLEPLTQEWIKPTDSKLEIFARELRPGWTCVGNEVLKFQELSCFELLD